MTKTPPTELQARVTGKTWQERHFSLMRIIRDICAENGIACLLHGMTALAAIRDGKVCDNPEFCIDVRDSANLLRAFSGLPKECGISIESMETTPFFPNFEYRVFDEGSIDFDVSTVDAYQSKGLSVGIQLVSHIEAGSTASKAFTELQDAYMKQAEANRLTGRTMPSKRILRSMPNVFALTPNKMSRNVFKKLSGMASKGGNSLSFNGKRLPKDLFTSSSTVELHGEAFPIPGDSKAYFTAMFGKNWRKKKVPKYKEGDWRFRDTAHTWEQFGPTIAHLDFKKINTQISLDAQWGKKYKEPHAIIAPYVGYLKRTHYYFTLQGQYRGKTEALQQMLADNRLDELGVELKPYLDKLLECHDMKLGLCFDESLFEVATGYLRAIGQTEYADKLVALVDAEAKNTIKLGQQK